MDTEVKYPWSRIATRNCPVCRLGGGQLEVGTSVVAETAGDGKVFLMRLSCTECGYTMLFDVEMARRSPYRDRSSVEVLPP